MLDETKLFDFVKIMFTKRSDYNKIKQHSKKRHHFMINRFFAIKYPSNANAFNLNRIDGASVVDCWSMVASRFKSVPTWFYTKTKKATKQKVDKYIPSEEAIQLYLDKNEICKREYQEMLKFAKNDLFDDLKNIEQQINVYGE